MAGQTTPAATPPARRRPGGIDVRGARVAALDRAFMARALELAARGRGRTHPNPMVGCVIVRDGRIVGEGYHQRPGAPHAEAVAVADAGGPDRVRGATVYVTLEPCAHHGRTPPCADLLVRCQPAEVVITHTDPDPRVAGRGIERLRAAGIRVITGVADDEARRLNEAWLTWIARGRPFIALKYAMSLDGKVAARGGHSRWITGETARARVHALRDEYDAILVGIGTVLADDPRLTCRRPGGRDPVRVILDSGARTPVTARVLSTASTAPTWIFVAEDAPEARCRALEQAGARIFPVPRGTGGLDLRRVCRELAEQNVVSVLVEGGPRVHRSFLEQRLCDKLYVFVGAKTVGGDDAPGPVAGQAVDHMDRAGTWRVHATEVLGGDLFCEVYPQEPGGA